MQQALKRICDNTTEIYGYVKKRQPHADNSRITYAQCLLVDSWVSSKYTSGKCKGSEEYLLQTHTNNQIKQMRRMVCTHTPVPWLHDMKNLDEVYKFYTNELSHAS